MVLCPRQLIQSVNGVAVSRLAYNEVLAQIKAGGRPLTLVFASSLAATTPSTAAPATPAVGTPTTAAAAVGTPHTPVVGDDVKTLEQAKAKIASLQAAVSKQQDLLRRLQADRKKLKGRQVPEPLWYLVWLARP